MIIACDFADPVGLDRHLTQVATRVASPDSRPGSASSRRNCASASLAAPHVGIETLDPSHVAHGKVQAPPGSIGRVAAFDSRL
jgi:hypothetical protein